MFESTVEENFQSWERFLDAYYHPIRACLAFLPFIGESQADDVAQSFFLKIYERDFLTNRPAIAGRFRSWLYVAARRHAIDEWRKARRRPDQTHAFIDGDPGERMISEPETAPFATDELYAVSILYLAVKRVRDQLIESGKADYWTVFEELVLAPMIPGRVPLSRQQLLATLPGQAPGILDNRVTTVKRIFRRVLPAVVPADPSAGVGAEERFQELLDIMANSASGRLWLAFLNDPRPNMNETSGSSLVLDEESAENNGHELAILLGFWLNTPISEYINDLGLIGPALAAVVRESRPFGLRGRGVERPAELTLKALATGDDARLNKISRHEQLLLFKSLKDFAKRVHHSMNLAGDAPARLTTSMPIEVANVLYSLAGALAIVRCGEKITRVSDDQLRVNLTWALERPWLDPWLRPVFTSAIEQLGPTHE